MMKRKFKLPKTTFSIKFKMFFRKNLSAYICSIMKHSLIFVRFQILYKLLEFLSWKFITLLDWKIIFGSMQVLHYTVKRFCIERQHVIKTLRLSNDFIFIYLNLSYCSVGKYRFYTTFWCSVWIYED